MNHQGLNNAAFYDDSSDDEMNILEVGHQDFGLGVNRAGGGGPVRLLAHRRQLPAVPAPAPIQTTPICIGKLAEIFCYPSINTF